MKMSEGTRYEVVSLLNRLIDKLVDKHYPTDDDLVQLKAEIIEIAKIKGIDLYND